MARPPRDRILDAALPEQRFRPFGSQLVSEGEVVLTLDEAEALRLADLEGLYQQAAATHMGVSRTTFGRIVASARRKTADAILHGKKLRVEGGPIAIGDRQGLPRKIAVPVSADGCVEEHFGRCRKVSVFTIGEGRSISRSALLDTDIGPGCKSGIFSVLAGMGVTALVAGCIGEGAIRIGASHGITVIRGASGQARSAAIAFARGELEDSGLECGRACMGTAKRCI
jgi:Predicted DNA-binding proteins